MNYREARYTVDDGLSLYYRVYGEGDDTILCFPGLTRNCKDFESLAGHLSSQWRVITPDLRGRGQSDRDPKWKRYLPPTYVGDAWALMDHLGIDKAVIIGTSLGGLMAMIMADQQPERLRGVVMNDVGPEVSPEVYERLLKYVGRVPTQPDWDHAVQLVKTNYGVAYPGADDAFWAHQARLAWDEAADGQVTPAHDPAIGDALRHANKAMPLVRFLQRLGVRRIKGINLDIWDNFRCLTMPVLQVRGELSDVLTEDLSNRTQQAKPDLQRVEVKGRGHAPTLDEPEVRAAIDAFLAGIKGGTQ